MNDASPPEIPSPFLPGTNIQYALDSTSLNALKTCPRLYQYTIIEGYRAKAENVHLRFGREYHQTLEEYDTSRTNGVKHEDAIHDVIRNLMGRTDDFHPDPATKAGKYKSRYNLVSLVVGYLDHFGPDDPAQTVILPDGSPATEQTFKFALDYGPLSDPNDPYLLCGHLDRVVTFNDEIMVMDRKTTTSTLSDYYFNQFEPNNQMSLYTLAGRHILDSPIKGVIIDAAQIMLDKPHRYIRHFTYRTPDQIEEWLQDLQILLRAAEGYAQAGHWPMNDTACDKFGGCQFRGVCSKSPHAREMFLKADFTKLEPQDRWNPLKPR